MDLKNESSNAVQGTVGTNNTPNSPKASTPATQGKGQAENKAKLTEQDKATQGKGEGNQTATPQTNTAEKEPVKTVVVQPVPEPKKVMSIEERLKALQMLQILRGQYENLLSRMHDLEEFELDILDNADELQENEFTGCKLIIMDGRSHQFSTTTPNLIKMVCTFLKAACLDKKVELEDKLVFPAA